MIKEGKFGVQEAICLMTITISSKVFFTSPALLTRFVATAAWYMTLISAAAAAVGFTFSFVLSAYLMFISAIFLREFVEVMKVFALPLSPPSFLIGIAVAVIIALCFLGLEAIERFSKLAGFLLLFSYAAVLFLSSQHFDMRRLFPIF